MSVTLLNFESINRFRDQLLDHNMYHQVNTPEKVKIMMKHHVFAVWDFMSLLKQLQASLTCVTVPWMPKSEPNFGRFVNEIVLGEETDEDGEGGYISHFELYLKAMKEVDADTEWIDSFLQLIKQGEDPLKALDKLALPDTLVDFVKHNLSLSLHGQTHEVAAAFFFGREDLIPDMFQILVDELEQKNIQTKWLNYYLKRHIELDGDEHGPLAEKLLLSLCGDDETKLRDVEKVAKEALQMRTRLWDGVVQEIETM